MTRIFVDGASGTVGLALAPHLESLRKEGLIRKVITLPDADRRDEEARKAAMFEADIVVLCLPDDVAKSAASLATSVNPCVRLLDASAVHRCAVGWVYGLPEVVPASLIRKARRVANPGCFASACILGAYPLRHYLRVSSPLVFSGVTGYSAGGQKMVDNPGLLPRLAQFGREHRHLAEIQGYGGAGVCALNTLVGNWYQGMLVQFSVPLPPEVTQVLLEDAYADFPEIDVTSAEALGYQVDPQCCNSTNRVQISVASQSTGGSTVAVVLDNLGKGSAGAACDNLRRMLS